MEAAAVAGHGAAPKLFDHLSECLALSALKPPRSVHFLLGSQPMHRRGAQLLHLLLDNPQSVFCTAFVRGMGARQRSVLLAYACCARHSNVTQQLLRAHAHDGVGIDCSLHVFNAACAGDQRDAVRWALSVSAAPAGLLVGGGSRSILHAPLCRAMCYGQVELVSLMLQLAGRQLCASPGYCGTTLALFFLHLRGVHTRTRTTSSRIPAVSDASGTGQLPAVLWCALQSSCVVSAEEKCTKTKSAMVDTCTSPSGCLHASGDAPHHVALDIFLDAISRHGSHLKQAALQRALVNCAGSGSLYGLERLLALQSPNAVDFRNCARRAFSEACRAGQEEMVRLLLHIQARRTNVPRYLTFQPPHEAGAGALQQAVCEGHVHIVQLLLSMQGRHRQPRNVVLRCLRTSVAMPKPNSAVIYALLAWRQWHTDEVLPVVSPWAGGLVAPDAACTSAQLDSTGHNNARQSEPGRQMLAGGTAVSQTAQGLARSWTGPCDQRPGVCGEVAAHLAQLLGLAHLPFQPRASLVPPAACSGVISTPPAEAALVAWLVAGQTLGEVRGDALSDLALGCTSVVCDQAWLRWVRGVVGVCRWYGIAPSAQASECALLGRAQPRQEPRGRRAVLLARVQRCLRVGD